MNLEMEVRENSSRIIILVFFIIFLSWSLLQFISPMVLPENTLTDLSGMTGISDNQKTVDEIPFPLGAVYGCGDRLCHQKAERSFFINGNQMPFCSRCTAIWLGLAIGMGFMVFCKIDLNEKFIFLIFIGLIPIGIDGLGQLFGVWESSHIVRVITGLLVGVVSGIAIGVIIDELRSLKKEGLRKN
jgi:uncharacterized membrane protein